MFFLSPTLISPGNTLFVFSTGTDSPVREASSAFRLTASRRRASAGIRSPVLKKIMSPGTSSFAGISVSFPSLRTDATGAAILFRASIARSARYSWIKPRPAAKRIMTKMTMASATSPTTADRTTATRRMIIMKFLNCSRKIFQGETFSPAASSL